MVFLSKKSVLSFGIVLTLAGLACGQSNDFWGAEPVVGSGLDIHGEPIGGGAGYSAILSPANATTTVSTAGGLLNALGAASAGDVIYVQDSASIDLSAYSNISIPAGVTLASGRGDGGSAGALLYSTKTGNFNLFLPQSDVRITGLRIRGPSGDDDPNTSTRGIQIFSSKSNVEIDNCELWMWTLAAISAQRLSNNGISVHHNYIHDCNEDGLGYGVLIYEGSFVVIESCKFATNRHSIASSGHLYQGAYDGYSAAYNIDYAGGKSHLFDMHRSSDTTFLAGGEIYIHHNTFYPSEQLPGNSGATVFIRGVPNTGAWCYQNWIKESALDPNHYYLQYTAAGWGYITDEYQRMYLSKSGHLTHGSDPYTFNPAEDENWYGTTPPPNSTNSICSASFTVDTNASPTIFFTDTSTASPGNVTSWSWSFDDGSTSSNQNPSHTYAAAGTYRVRLAIGTSDGCSSAVSNDVTVTVSGGGTPGIINWTDGGGGSSWHTPANWDLDRAPIGGDDVRLNSAASGGVDYSVAANVGANGLYQLQPWYGSILNIRASMDIGDGTISYPFYVLKLDTIVNHSAGTLTVNSAGAAGAMKVVNGATYNQSSSASVSLNGALDLFTYGEGTASYNLTGGSLTLSDGSINVGTVGTGFGMFIFDGSELSVTVAGANQDLNVGSLGTLKLVGDASEDRLELTGSNGSLDFLANSTCNPVVNNPGDKFLSVGGDIVISSGAILNVTNPGGVIDGTFDILSVVGGGSIVGDFSSINLPEGAFVADNGQVDGTYTIIVGNGDPTTPPPAPVVSIVTVGTGQDVISWTTVPGSGYVYSVYYSTNLLDGFIPLQTNLADTVQLWTNTIDVSPVFYQIKAQ